jgi:hypothetical protein
MNQAAALFVEFIGAVLVLWSIFGEIRAAKDEILRELRKEKEKS